MSSEIELERLVVRIIGDDKSYRDMMENAVKEAGKLAKASNDSTDSVLEDLKNLSLSSGELESASKRVVLSTKEVEQALRQESNTSLNAAKNVVDLGASYTKLIGIVALVGTAIKATNFIIENSIKYDIKEAKQIAKESQELSSEITSGFNQSPQGNQFMRDKLSYSEASSFGQQKYQKAKEDLALIQAKSEGALEQKQAKERLELSEKGGFQRIMPDFMALLGGHVNAKSALSSKQEQDRNTNKQELIAATLHQQEATDRYKDSLRQEALAITNSIGAGKEYIANKDQTIGWLERSRGAAAKSSQDFLQAKAALEASQAYNVIDPGHEAEGAFRASRNLELEAITPGLEKANDLIQEMYKESDTNRMKRFFELESKYMNDKINRAHLIGAASAKQAAIDQALQQGKTPEQATSLGELAARLKLTEAEVAYNLALEKTRISQKFFAAELVSASNPKNESLKVAIKAAKAYEEWAQANKDLVAIKGEEMKATLTANAAQELSMVYTNEGAGLVERYMLPLQRAIRDSERLNKIQSLGGFGKGVQGEWAFRKSSEEAYGQAHKDYSSQIKGQPYEALIGRSNATDRALYEYRLGSTVIPRSEMQEKNTQKEATEKTDKALVTGIQEMTTGINTLVELGKLKKNTLELSLANFK